MICTVLRFPNSSHRYRYLKSVMWIRIRIKVDLVHPDPYGACRSGSRRLKKIADMQQKSGRNLRHMKNLYLNSRFISSNQILKNLLYFYNNVNFVRKLTFRPGFRRQSLPEPGYLFGWSRSRHIGPASAPP